jgi:hypothetical protein
MIDTIVKDLRASRLILFAGAGVSRNLKLPSWGQLMDELAHQLDFDPAVFQQLGGYLELAEYYEAEKRSLGGLRSWMDRTWHGDEARVDTSRIHNAIVNLRAPLIYTTNYDRWLEIAFTRRMAPFAKVANVGDIAQIKDGVTQIVKFHGDFDDDASLVLTEKSYFDRLSFESPLDIKLRSDSLGKAILFIGYSLSDINVRYLLYKLHRLWEASGLAPQRPQSFMFMSRPNPVQEAILSRRGIQPIISERDDPGDGLADFLERLVKEAFGTTP